MNLRPSGYEWQSATADFPSTGYVFSGSLLIFDSKEPVEFWLSQLTTILAFYNTNIISKQINKPFDGLEQKYMIADDISALIGLELPKTIKRSVTWMQTPFYR